MSSRGSLPSKEQISQVLSHIQDEIEAVHPDGRLTLLVLREIGKALSNLAQRAECQVYLTSFCLLFPFAIGGIWYTLSSSYSHYLTECRFYKP